MGLVALVGDGYVVVGADGLVVNVDYSLWGRVHLLLGLVAFSIGFCVMSGQTWARAVGITIALVGAGVNVAFIGAFPIWATILIIVDVLII